MPAELEADNEPETEAVSTVDEITESLPTEDLTEENDKQTTEKIKMDVQV